MIIEDFKFSDLSVSAEREMAIILGKITHHIHPKIVNYIVQENNKYEKYFQTICHYSCNTNSFFYQDSDCVFPGFRRPVHKEKQGS